MPRPRAEDVRAVKVVARNLRLLREIRGLSQAELARKVGISPSYLCGMERGRLNVSIRVLERLAIALEVPIKLLFEEDLLSLPLSAFEPYPHTEDRKREIEEEKRKAEEQLQRDLERLKTALKVFMGVEGGEDPHRGG